jgi:K+-sensing histidine kinase KdpD
VLLVATRCGVAAGVLGSILAALIFAYFLYQPIGSVTVTSKEAREKLAWMLLGGLVLSFLLGGFKSGGEHRSS